MENLTFGPRKLKKVPKKDAEEMAMHYLKRIGLEEKAHVYPTTISGGQQQRIAIARAMTMQNRVILFDGPTSALGPEMVPICKPCAMSYHGWNPPIQKMLRCEAKHPCTFMNIP